MNAMSMSSDASEWDSEEDCEWEWDIPQQGVFAHGEEHRNDDVSRNVRNRDTMAFEGCR